MAKRLTPVTVFRVSEAMSIPRLPQPEDQDAAEQSSVQTGDIAGVDNSNINIAGRDYIGTLVQHIEKVVIQPQTGVLPGEDEAPAEGKSPYLGLQYFDVRDAEWYFGRGALTCRLVALLRENHFLAVVGASGSGKSSLVRAGLVAAMKKGEALVDGTRPPTGSERWQYQIITPSAHPLQALAICLSEEQASMRTVTTLMDDMQSDERCLNLAVFRFLQRRGSDHLLLVVDQFEELYTLCADAAERRAFVDNLLKATADGTSSATMVVITLRADFYHHCAQFDNLRAALEKHQVYMGVMSEAELRQAIEEPARLGGWELETGLVDQMLSDIGADSHKQPEPGALPLLSHALLETWNKRKGRRLTLAGYRETGGVRGSIAHSADLVYRGLKPDEQEIARNIFLRLTELGDSALPTRRRAELDELILEPQQQTDVNRVLDILTEARLVTRGENSAEVAHEALIREWPELQSWIEQNRENLHIRHHLSEAVNAWEKMDRDPGDLYRGVRLAQALEWEQVSKVQLSSTEREFLRRSRALHQQETRNRRLAWASAVIGLLFTTVLVTLVITGQLNLKRFFYRPLPAVWVEVPAGEFLMGSPSTETDAFSSEQPQHVVNTDRFEIMAHEVTNGQYAQCVRAGICFGAGSSADTSSEKNQYPVTSVSWDEARTFCVWIGGRLPSEAEWEKAARGGLQAMPYPWGSDAPTCRPGATNGALFSACDRKSALPVGSFQPNGYRIYDMAGNVWEWVADFYDAGYYAVSPASNPSGPERGEERALRGGSWANNISYLRIAFRYWLSPEQRTDVIGFRCARSP